MPPAARPAITDSPWLWVLLFSLFALAMVVVMSRKYDLRQANIERNYQARERVAEKITAENNPTDIERLKNLEARPAYAAPGNRLIKLWPLAILLGLLSMVSAVMLFRVWIGPAPPSDKNLSP